MKFMRRDRKIGKEKPTEEWREIEDVPKHAQNVHF